MNMMMTVMAALDRRVPRDEDGAIGWLLIGIVLGVLLVIGLIVKLLIPGD